MDNIEDIFTSDAYGPLILYCRERGWKTMLTLIKNFSDLAACGEITPALTARVRSVLAAYCKQHPDLMLSQQNARPRRTAKPQPPADCVNRLRDYFEQHADTLIRVADVTKALGLKRSDVMRTLEEAPWCKAVDASTWFYAPAQN